MKPDPGNPHSPSLAIPGGILSPRGDPSTPPPRPDPSSSPDLTDWDLLERWIRQKSDVAFTSLVRRHLPFVYACARRQVGPDLAPDVAQSVFLILARKAPTFRANVILSSWLFRTTGFVVAQLRRSHARRTRLETEATFMHPTSTEADSSNGWRLRLEPHLDAALASLSETDRRYVLTRFFEQQRFSDLAKRFGVSEDAAKKRVARALERMRCFLTTRGVAIPSATLAGLLLDPRAEALPPGLTASTLSKTVQHALSAGARVPGSFTDLAEAALRQSVAEAWRRGILHVAAWVAGFALLVTLGSITRSAFLTPSSQAPQPTSTVASETVPDTPTAANLRDPVVDRALVLELLDETTGTPIANAEVLLGQLFAENDARRWSVVTDEGGRVPVALGSRSFEWLEATISLAGYVKTVIQWRGYEFTQDTAKYICHLRHGVALAGEVRDSEGQPIPDAQIAIRGPSGYEDGSRESSSFSLALSSDANGRFLTDQVALPRERFRQQTSGEHLVLEAYHPDYAVGRTTITETTETPAHLVIVLQRGNTVVGRVLDPSGAPIVGAVIRELGVSSSGREAMSDTLGAFELANVGSSAVHIGLSGSSRITPKFALEVSATGYQLYQISSVATPDGEGILQAFSHPDSAPPHGQPIQFEWIPTGSSNRPQLTCRVSVDLILTPDNEPGSNPDLSESGFRPPSGPIRLAGTVVDDATGAAIPRFRIHSTYPGNGYRNLLGEGLDGAFDWTLPHRGGLVFTPLQDLLGQNAFSWPAPDSSTFRISLQAVAEGYLPADILASFNDGAATSIAFRLRNADDVTGWIEQPNTRPAIGALLGMGGEGTTFLRDAHGNFRWEKDTRYTTWTESEGRFRITRSPAADRLQIVHPEGCALFPLPASPDTIIRLEPWANVEGEAVTADGSPAVGAEVRLEPEAPPSLGRPYGFQFRYSTRTDDQGRFLFPQVPPGRVVASLLGATAQGSTQVPARTASGRTLKVRLVAPAE